MSIPLQIRFRPNLVLSLFNLILASCANHRVRAAFECTVFMFKFALNWALITNTLKNRKIPEHRLFIPINNTGSFWFDIDLKY